MSNRVEYLKPLNRYVTIIPHFNENRAETGVLLPEDFKQEDSRFIKATIVHVATDCKDDLKRMKNTSRSSTVTAVVDRAMIEEVDLSDRKHYVVLENYIVYRGPNES